jgi:hypothetical protein
LYCSIENKTVLNHAKRGRGIVLPLRSRIICLILSFIFLIVSPKSNAQIVINEIGIGAPTGDAGGGGEFIELFNKSGCTQNIGCYVLVYSGPSGVGWSVTIPSGTTLGPGQYYLIGGHSSNLIFSSPSSWTNVAAGTSTSWINNYGATYGNTLADLDLEKANTSGKGMVIGNLPNVGGQVTLFKSNGTVASSVSYNNGNNSGTYPAVANNASGCSLTTIANPGNASTNFNNTFSSYYTGIYLDQNGAYQLTNNEPNPPLYPTPGKPNNTNGINTQMAVASLPLANVGNINAVCAGSSATLGSTTCRYNW